MGFIDKVLGAKFGFDAIGKFFKGLYEGGFSGKVEELWDKLWDMLAVIHPFAIYILLALSLVQLLFGKRLLAFQRFIGCFAVGYAAAVVYLVPVLESLVAAIVDYAWIVGIVCGVIAVLLRKLIYIVVYIAAFAYIPYYLVYSGKIVPSIGNNLIYAGVAAAAFVVLALLLRKWVETLGLAALGAHCTILCLDKAFNIFEPIMNLSFIPANGMFYISLAVLGVLTLIGFVIQVKTRKRF